jgi:SAM-dependent methyltransferase
MQSRNWLRKKLYKRKSLFDPTKNYSNLPRKLIKKYSGKKILNIGSGDESLGDEVITLDKFEKARITADASRLPIKSESIDLALSIAVLEHLPEPAMAVEEMFRVLKPNAELYVEIPFLQPFHASPYDYFRATLPGLKYWCRHFKEIESGVCVGPGSAVAWLEIEYIRLWFGKIPLFGILFELIFRAWSLPLKFLDRFLIRRKDAPIAASAIYFHGKKVSGRPH